MKCFRFKLPTFRGVDSYNWACFWSILLSELSRSVWAATIMIKLGMRCLQCAIVFDVQKYLQRFQSCVIQVKSCRPVKPLQLPTVACEASSFIIRSVWNSLMTRSLVLSAMPTCSLITKFIHFWRSGNYWFRCCFFNTKKWIITCLSHSMRQAHRLVNLKELSISVHYFG